MHPLVLALAASTNLANASQFHRHSAYHRIIDRATIAALCLAHGFEQEETERTEQNCPVSPVLCDLLFNSTAQYLERVPTDRRRWTQI